MILDSLARNEARIASPSARDVRFVVVWVSVSLHSSVQRCVQSISAESRCGHDDHQRTRSGPRTHARPRPLVDLTCSWRRSLQTRHCRWPMDRVFVTMVDREKKRRHSFVVRSFEFVSVGSFVQSK